MHPIALRLLGFRGGTVPAMRIDGERVQGSRAITAYLERTRPDPPLYPAGAEERAAVVEAERWGESVLQPVPRRIFRYAAGRDQRLRRWTASEIVGMPLPGLMAAANKPVALVLGRRVGAVEERVRADVEGLPALLDRVADLIAAGTIGGDEPNAADLQILTTIRSLQAFSDLEPLISGTAAAGAAERLIPPAPGPVPRTLPQDWLDRAQAISSAADKDPEWRPGPSA